MAGKYPPVSYKNETFVLDKRGSKRVILMMPVLAAAVRAKPEVKTVLANTPAGWVYISSSSDNEVS
jgi:hypothetical protein